MTDLEVLPCGCLFKTEVKDNQNTGTYVPCRKTCENYRYMLLLAKEAKKPLTFVKAP